MKFTANIETPAGFGYTMETEVGDDIDAQVAARSLVAELIDCGFSVSDASITMPVDQEVLAAIDEQINNRQPSSV